MSKCSVYTRFERVAYIDLNDRLVLVLYEFITVRIMCRNMCLQIYYSIILWV